MNKLITKICVFIVDETGGETAEWAGVIGIVIAIAVAAYNIGLQDAIVSAIASIINMIRIL